MEKKDLKKLSDPSFHKSLGIELNWRIGDKVGNGIFAIYPYYTADQCREILDAAVGPENWYNEFREVNNILFCTIGIKIDGDFIEKADAGGPRHARKKNLTDEDEETFRAKTAASSAFVRAAEAWGIGRHKDLIPEVALKVQNGMAINPQNGKAMNTEELCAYCNQITLPVGYLYAIYRQRKALFDENQEAMELMKRMKELLSE